MSALDAISHSIQLSVAPVFMLTAIAALIGALAMRLARIIDRARTLEDRLEGEVVKHEADIRLELKRLRQRGRVVNSSMILLTLAGVSIGATVMALFLVETASLRSSAVVPWAFLGGVGFFLLALLCFLVETLLAARSLNFGRRGQKTD